MQTLYIDILFETRVCLFACMCVSRHVCIHILFIIFVIICSYS